MARPEETDVPGVFFLEIDGLARPVLERASAELADALAYYPEAVDIDDGFSPGKQQIDFKIRPEA